MATGKYIHIPFKDMAYNLRKLKIYQYRHASLQPIVLFNTHTDGDLRIQAPAKNTITNYLW